MPLAVRERVKPLYSALSRKFSPPKFVPCHSFKVREVMSYLNEMGVKYKVQDKTFVTDSEIMDFIERFDHVLIHQEKIRKQSKSILKTK